ncbi:carboxyl-terminal processing protease [Hymenobacter daecheongensis DSM 21074]|uniref:Carboxyl-terminal processing protease n=1 Tax=Hymenobacter daecheongensis DSM 21074 TaxID=1121955 RepID=A0A1M6J870_9BACT|nr:S41 family peptidase [Hymenobacter daecheongensis]SHJ42888.1 carboxyl-terminal processing protease [Hymenobacter daecheongensis DSM 21074]
MTTFFRRLVWLLLALLPAAVRAQAPLTPAQYQQDFDYFWTTIHDNYAYFDQKQTDWARVRELYAAQLPAVGSRAQFVRLLENALNELYDNHASLSTNLPDSRRLLPSGTDVWAQYRQGKATVVAVRAGFGAERVGVRPGMEIVAVNDVPIAQAVAPLLGRSLKTVDEAAREVALNQALAGTHNTPRKLTLRAQGRLLPALYPDAPGMQLENIRYPHLLESRRLGTIGYIRINNSLGNNALIAAFDSTLDALAGTTGLVLDLRETPGGGNSTVARAIMGRFITQEQPYQRHEFVAEERRTGIRRSTLELVSGRARPYTRPLVVLVGRWTSSMGEGITIGLDAMRRAAIMGTEMARLHGAITSFRLPNSDFGFHIPTERLYRPDGLPREDFVPAELISTTGPGATDAPLEKALQHLRSAAKP